MMVLDNEFAFGDIVYIKTDKEQLPRMVTYFKVLPRGLIVYTIACGAFESYHYDFELSREVNVLLMVTN